MKIFEQLLESVFAIFTAMGIQLLLVGGVLFLLGFALYYLAQYNRRIFVQSLGPKADIIWTGWLGTPVHELGHAIFCILFNHRITDIKLFDPREKSGSLGFVLHTYNTKSFYQRVGNFFISTGPIIFGTFCLYVLMYYLLPNKESIFDIVYGEHIKNSSYFIIFKQQIYQVVNASWQVLVALFQPSNLHDWRFWLFLYLSLSIASHMELSPSDLKGMRTGFLTLLFLLFFVNVIVLVFDLHIKNYILTIAHFSTIVSGLFTFAVVISGANLIISFVITYIFKSFKKLFHRI